ncbi:MAG: TetR/AcrR family transcriptional regulator [Sulfurimonas sp.]|nr:TetR/AcrR family transcriptional regulator [Sulfurimonas sp.]
MAIIVDKVQKRKNIALACKNLFINNSIKSLSVSEIAVVASIGKGTLYNYFNNKEEILFEIVNMLVKEHDIQKRVNLSKESSVKGKIKVFSSFFYSEKDKELRELYKKFVSISLDSPSQEMKDFQTKHTEYYYEWMGEIIQNGVDKGEIIPISLDLLSTFFAVGEGLFIASNTTNQIDNIEEKINFQIDTLFRLIKADR